MPRSTRQWVKPESGRAVTCTCQSAAHKGGSKATIHEGIPGPCIPRHLTEAQLQCLHKAVSVSPEPCRMAQAGWQALEA